MKIKTILATSICLWSVVGLTACGSRDSSGSSDTQPEQNQPDTGDNNTGSDNSGGDNSGGDNKNGEISGKVISDITNTSTCQLYLYDQSVTKFADAFDQTHDDFNMPESGINGTAPLSTSSISESGNYHFTNVEPGSYKLVLNCLVSQDVQDQSQLVDDPIQYNGFNIPNPDGIVPNIVSVSLTDNSAVNEDFIDSRIKPDIDENADVVVKVDVTDPNARQATLHDMWGTINRIAPKNGVTIIDGLKVNTVRMLGGILKTDENGNKVPDLDYDIASYNEQSKEYEYNFQPLVNRINAIINKGHNLHQIVLDQPPWAFQTGYTFIPEGQKDGIHFRENERISHYGNSLPPKDKEAYNQFLQATISHLVSVYGEETVLSWRFRIGTEIETPDHWYGTEQDFVEHFANSVKAIRAVLPQAKIGLHTRTPSFVYKNGTVTNYKNEPIKSFANAIIEYCYDNNIKYDFWGVSDYPFITNASTRDPKSKFEHFFKPLVEHPKWQQDTIIDIEEYTVITHMGFVPPYYAYISSDSPQADTFNVALTDEFYQHQVDQVFQWGLRNGEKPWNIKVFETMFGLPRISAEVNTDTVGSIVVSDPADNSIQAVSYHYDPKDLEAKNDRNVKLSFNVDKPVGTTFYYRKKLAAPDHHAFYSFMNQSAASNWLKSGRMYNKYGRPDIVLNETGLAQWQNYQHPTSIVWSDWKAAVTVAKNNKEAGSQVIIDTVLPLFSYEKTEIKWSNN